MTSLTSLAYYSCYLHLDRDIQVGTLMKLTSQLEWLEFLHAALQVLAFWILTLLQALGTYHWHWHQTGSRMVWGFPFPATQSTLYQLGKPVTKDQRRTFSFPDHSHLLISVRRHGDPHSVISRLNRAVSNFNFEDININFSVIKGKISAYTYISTQYSLHVSLSYQRVRTIQSIGYITQKRWVKILCRMCEPCNYPCVLEKYAAVCKQWQNTNIFIARKKRTRKLSLPLNYRLH